MPAFPVLFLFSRTAARAVPTICFSFCSGRCPHRPNAEIIYFAVFRVGRGLAPAVYHLRRIVDIYGFLGRERRPRRSEINNYSFIRTLSILSPTGSSFSKEPTQWAVASLASFGKGRFPRSAGEMSAKQTKGDGAASVARRKP